ncbi:prepilin peptidase [Kineothrix sp. MB12-C1]|uniref:prepilin peptidase n=1 Tax=Kineothrix sp. MB12-C1 TaxID=3070215 RepID=UPI0027D24511|nr:prepilin peptidase [Kineothrix sp. MB12-C1]WMC94342.1 prepilin peptidase [Kineothrix sp. MB12-C1]
MDIQYIAAIIFLGICMVFDLWKREIPILLIGVFGIISLVGTVIIQEFHWHVFLYSLIPGATMLGLSLCTGESIGYGDGFVVLVLGIFLGFSKCALAVLLGLLFSAILGLGLLVLQKVNGKSQMPFIPFIAMGLGVILFV